jgi:hypothetical protein
VTCAVCVGAGVLSVAGGVEVAPAAGVGVDAAAGLGLDKKMKQEQIKHSIFCQLVIQFQIIGV